MYCYKRNKRDSSEMKTGDLVRIKRQGKLEQKKKALVQRKVNRRSKEVQSGDWSIPRLSRVHLRRTSEVRPQI